MDMNEIKETLEGLDPLKISETYDRMKDTLENAGLIEVPQPEPTVVHRSGGLPTGAVLTPREVARMMHPNTPNGPLTAPIGAQLKTTNLSWSTVMENEDAAIANEEPHFTAGLSHAQTMALANAVKEKLSEDSEVPKNTSLYEQFDDTLTKLFEEIENSDTLSDGQKSALLMKVHMTSASILKKKYEVNV